MNINEDNFIKEMKKGNEKSLFYVIDNYGWILKTVIKKHLFYLPSYYDEVMNDCLLSIWENINSYDSEKSSFKNWVGSIAKYKSIDYIRKYLKERENRNIEDMVIVAEDSPLKEILKNEVNEQIRQISKTVPVIIVTHNSTVGASIKPDYILYTKKEIIASKAVYKVYAGNPSDGKLKSIDGEETSNYDIMLNCLEAGDSAYIERNQSYENLRS